MIVEIPDDNSIVKWKMNDKDEWKSAEISDLINAYEERQQGDLISRSALKEQVKNEVCEVCFDSPDERQCSPNCKLCTFKQLIDNAQPVEPERITGEWIPLYPRTVGEWEYKCSNCGHRGFMHQHNFCPDCGADMREGIIK